jgi:hypothetical protein
MARKDKKIGLNDSSLGTKPDEKITAAILARVQDEKIACGRALEVARELSVPQIEVGYAADKLQIRIIQCQLGLFGYEPEKRIVQPASSMDKNLENNIRADLVDGRLPCAAAFSIAKKRRISKLDVSSACERMKIKISSCQLGAFS